MHVKPTKLIGFSAITFVLQIGLSLLLTFVCYYLLTSMQLNRTGVVQHDETSFRASYE